LNTLLIERTFHGVPIQAIARYAASAVHSITVSYPAERKVWRDGECRAFMRRQAADELIVSYCKSDE